MHSRSPWNREQEKFYFVNEYSNTSSRKGDSVYSNFRNKKAASMVGVQNHMNDLTAKKSYMDDDPAATYKARMERKKEAEAIAKKMRMQNAFMKKI